MRHDPTPTQALLLFSLLARHGACAQAELMPAVKKADREALIEAKLIGARKVGRGLALTLTDAGWAWTAAHLSAELPPAQCALGDLLARLGAYLERSGATLAEVIGAKPTPDEPPPKPSRTPSKPPTTRAKPSATSAKAKSPRSATARASGKTKASRTPTAAALRKRIEAAYLKITGRRKDQSVRLARLRAELADLDRTMVDEALGHILKGDAKASLMRHDDPRQLDRADHEAAFAPAGEPFHLLWIAS